uniref:AP-5 complex subunit beta-1 n=1 Tax=Sphenodon punctatus TaxID=8508 RepID=A0A8D0G6W6_SPHPU
MLTLLLEFPTLLCPDPEVGEQTAGSLLVAFAQLAPMPKLVWLRCHLLFATGTLLVTTDAFGEGCRAARDYLSLLLHLTSDLNDRHGGPGERPVRTAACECLRELESCYPGLLSRRLETLRSLQQQEASPAHQAYTLLYGLALRNAVLLLARRRHQGALGELLSGNEGLAWEAAGELGALSPAAIDQLLLLPSPADAKELKGVLSLLLDGSYLLAPAAQSALLWQLAQAVSVVRTQSPAIFKAQLVRLFGAADVALLHAILQLKALFTDSLFTGEDEAFLLRRLVGLAQHPALPAPVRLFYLDCLIRFPENRPLGEEGLPVLLTPPTAAGLFPNLFQDPGTTLARLNLLGLVCVESEGAEAERGAGYLLEHVLALGELAARQGGHEAAGLFFRAIFLFARYFGARTQPMWELTCCLLGVYRRRRALAPNLINLLDEAHAALEMPAWPSSLARALQELVVALPLEEEEEEEELGWHLKLLARLAKESGIPQGSTVSFLWRLVGSGQLGDWRSGQALLRVCRNLLQLQPPPALAQLADLLQTVALSHGDVDVQDRARFYYTLLTSLSAEKLGAVLASGDCPKARTLSSSIVADSESFAAALTVHPAKRAPMQLQREGPTRAVPAAPRPCPPEQDVEGYCQGLLEPGDPSQLCLTYRLVPVKPPQTPLFSVVLRFSCSDPHYEPVPELCVPCLSSCRPPPTLTLVLQPRCPYPTLLGVSALYTTPAGLTYCAQMEPLHVAFPDLFVPLALPAWPPESQHRLFDALWHQLHPDGASECAESFLCWPVAPQPLGALVRDHFAGYLVAEGPNLFKIGMSLPPQHHVLLRVQSAEDSARVGIRTDHWKVLPHLSEYLQSLVGAG